MKLCTFSGGLALAWQLKVVLSAVLNGSNVRVLVNNGLEPDTADIVTLESLLDKDVFPLIQLTSISVTETSVSMAVLMEMVQVRVRGAILPANSGPEGTLMRTLGVETEWEKYTKLSLTIDYVYFLIMGK